METLNTFGDRLKALRIERNLLQSEFGEIIGERMGTKRISPSAVGSYERNEREPSYAILCEFADFFGVSLDYLLCRSEERLKKNLRALKNSEIFEQIFFDFSWLYYL
jgi:transcriptional regulator with XRE-family HTH domain